MIQKLVATLQRSFWSFALVTLMLLGVSSSAFAQAGMSDGPETTIAAGAKFITTIHFTTASVWPAHVLIPGVVSVSNGSASRWVIVRFSSDAYNSLTTNKSTTRLSVDGGPCVVAGGELFNVSHIAGGFIQHRAWQGLVFTGPGAHTYQMCGAAEGGGTVSWGFRTLTVEAKTK
jgi:hypothetical protein